MTTETKGDIVKTSTYDVMGNRIGFTVTKGGTAILANTYTYDATGKMLSVTSNGQTVNYTYDANGNLLSETGNNHGVTNTYNKSNMLTVKQNTSGGTLCNNYSITRDYAGNATKVTDSLAGYDRRYNYDLFGRLYYETISHNREGEVEFDMEYIYDRFGNRFCELKTMINSDDVYYREYEYGQYNQLSTITTEAISDTFVPYTISYTYDGNGNLSGSTKTIETDEVIENKTYTFNNAGRMMQSTKDGVTTSYTYNGDGLRMSKTTNGVTTSFILDGADVVAEIKGNEITAYSRGLGLVSQTKGDTTKTYFSDDHGNITSLHSADADSEEALYDGFGNTLFNDSTDNPFGYCGEYYDEETGLIYLRARYYDPETGRFISEDPAMDGTNWYVYCSNNPVKFVDPSGMRSKKDADEIIKKNADYIIEAAEMYGVNPGILGATIYAEQRLNVDWKDDWFDGIVGFYGILDTSIGVSQIKISTAKLLENEGYMPKITAQDGYIYIPLIGKVNGTEKMAREKALENPKINIRYAAAYLKYYQDRWESVYPEIDGRTAILATLYNQGEKNPPHSNPKPNDFGEFAKDNYYYVRNLLGL